MWEGKLYVYYICVCIMIQYHFCTVTCKHNNDFNQAQNSLDDRNSKQSVIHNWVIIDQLNLY